MKAFLSAAFCLVAIKSTAQSPAKISLDKIKALEDQHYWLELGTEELLTALSTRNNEKIAKNIILFIGDGMGGSTITAARHYKGQSQNKPQLSFETFPFSGLSKTYCVDNQTPDSACSASAIYSGIKTNYDTYGYDSNVQYKNSSSVSEKNEVTTILRWAQDSGKATGFATTTRVTHATPGALYARTVDRDYECDGEIPSDDVKSRDVAWQLVNTSPGKDINVILGGGRPAFFPESLYAKKYGNGTVRAGEMADEGSSYNYEDDSWKCRRKDGINLVEQWIDDKGPTAKFVDNLIDLKAVDSSDTDYLMGLFAESHTAWSDKRDPILDPSLSDMALKALEVLGKCDNGFFLMVEGGRIDHAHHENWASRALYEVIEFDKAIEAILNLVDLEETLVIVTADHGHAFVMSGYSTRGSDIRGVSSRLMSDGLPSMILNYANGPSFYQHYYATENGNVSRFNLSSLDSNELLSPKFRFPSGMYRGDDAHGGEDVITYAVGPMAHLLQGTHEQTHLAYVMSLAACIGPMRRRFSLRCSYSYSPSEEISRPPKTMAIFIEGIRTTPAIWFVVFLACLLIVFYCTTTGKRRQKEEYDDL